MDEMIVFRTGDCVSVIRVDQGGGADMYLSVDEAYQLAEALVKSADDASTYPACEEREAVVHHISVKEPT